MKKTVLFIFICFVTVLFAEYNEKTILLRRAKSAVITRQYEKAEMLYEEILKNFPEEDVITAYLELLLNLKKHKKFEAKYNEFYSTLSLMSQTKLQAEFHLKKGNNIEAEKLVSNYFEKNKGRINEYKLFSLVFQNNRDYRFAIKLLLDAQKVSNSKDIYNYELGNLFMMDNDFKMAIYYFVKHVEKNRNYQYSVLNQFRKILKLKPKLIDEIAKQCEQSKFDWVHEIYAKSLVEVGNYQKAIDIYKTLDEQTFQNFVRQELKKSRINTAELGLNYLIESKNEEIAIWAKIELVKIYMNNNNLEKSELILLDLYKNSDKIGKKGGKTLKKEVCVLLARIKIIQQKPITEVRKYFSEAISNSYYKERELIKLEEINYLIFKGKLDIAKQLLDKLKSDNTGGTFILDKILIPEYIISLQCEDVVADSLLGEIILAIPEDDDALEALQLSQYLQNIKDKSSFWNAYRRAKLHNFKEASQILYKIANEEKNEQLMIMAAEWAFLAKDNEDGINILNYKFNDDDLQAYADILKKYYGIKTIEKSNIEALLIKNPSHVFSSHLRNLLEN